MAKDKEDMGRKDLGKESGMHKPDDGGKLGGDVGKQGGDLGKHGDMPSEKKEWSPEKKQWGGDKVAEKKPGA